MQATWRRLCRAGYGQTVLGPVAEGMLRRPGVGIAVTVAVLAVSALFAVGAPERLPVLGSLGDEEPPRGELVLVTSGKEPVRSPVYRTALDVIAARVEAEGLVTAVRDAPVGADRRTTALIVTFEPSAGAGERERAAEAMVEGIDPGPLRVLATGLAPTGEEARDAVQSDLAELELLVAPLVLLVLLAAGGWRFALVALVAAATGALGAIAGLRLLGELTDAGAAGIAAGAGVAVVVAVEGALTIGARSRGGPGDASEEGLVRGAVRSAAVLVPATAAAILAPLAILVVSVPVARSAAAGAALGAGLATIAALLVAPALLAIGRHGAEPGGVGEQEERPPRRLARALLRRWPLAAALLAVAVATLVAAALPFEGSEPVALAPGGLPADSDAARGAELAGKELDAEKLSSIVRPTEPDDLTIRLAIAAGIAALLVAAACFALARSAAAIALGAVSVLPAAAALGLLELVFGAGRLSGTLDYAPAREPSATAAIIAPTVLGAVAALRAVRAAPLLRRAGGPRNGSTRLRGVRRLTRLELGPALAGSVVGALVFGALAGSELLPAKEVGLAVAVGLLLDLLLVRCLIVPALARLGG
jgi:hypothetical protein